MKSKSVKKMMALITAVALVIGLFPALAFAVEVDTTAPTLSSVSVSGGNKIVSMKFSENIYMGTGVDGTTKLNVKSFKAAITFSDDGDTYVALGDNDKVAISKDTLNITFKNALDKTKSYTVNVTAQAIQDLKKNKISSSITTSPLELDNSSPTILASAFDTKSKKVTVYFSELITHTNADKFKTKTGLVTVGGVEANPTSVAVSKNMLTVNLPKATSYTGTTEVGLIAATLKISDLAGNAIADVTTTPDMTKPTKSSTAYSNSNKDFEITLSESVTSVAKVPAVASVNIFKAANATTKNDNKEYIETKTAPKTTITVSGDKITVSNLKAALVEGDKIQIKAGIVADAAQNKNEIINITVTLPDVTAPTISATSSSDVTDISAKINFTSSEAGTYYFMLTPGDTTEPTKATVKAGGEEGQVNGSGAVTTAPKTFTISTGMEAGMNYNVFLVVEDAAGNISNVATINFDTTADTTAPSVTAFQLNDDGGGQVSGSFTTDEAGFFRIVFIEDGNAAPTNADVAGSYGQIAGYFSGFEGFADSGLNETGGSGYSGIYDVYLIVQDGFGNISEIKVLTDFVVEAI